MRQHDLLNYRMTVPKIVNFRKLTIGNWWLSALFSLIPNKKVVFNKKLKLQLILLHSPDAMGSTWNMLASSGLRWWQRVFVRGMHEHCSYSHNPATYPTCILSVVYIVIDYPRHLAKMVEDSVISTNIRTSVQQRVTLTLCPFSPFLRSAPATKCEQNDFFIYIYIYIYIYVNNA